MNTKFIYNRKSKLNTNGMALIQLQIIGDRLNRPLKSTRIYIEPQFWDEKRQIVKKKHPEADFLNKQLKIFQKKWIDFLLPESLKPGGIDWDKIKTIRDIDNLTLDQGIDFINYFENTVIKIFNNGKEKGTLKSYNQTLRKLKLFSKKDALPISKINYEFCQNFQSFMINASLNSQTREKHFKNIKAGLNHAIKQGLVDRSLYPFDKFKFKAEKTESKALSYKEIKEIERLDVSYNGSLEKAKDMFLFSCYTSIRFCDLVSLSFDNFINENGNIKIKYIQEKTNTPVSYCLSNLFKDEFGVSKPVKIYQKYAERLSKGIHSPKGTVKFFGWTNQTYNKYLKEIGRLVNVSQKLTAHVGRYSAITILINTFDLPVQTVQKIAGHINYQTTLGYYKQEEKDIDNSTNNVTWK